MVRRIAVAVVAIPIALFLTWYGGWPFTALIATVAVLGVGEALDLAELGGIRGFRRSTLVVAALAAPLVFGSLHYPEFGTWMRQWWLFAPAALVILFLLLALSDRLPNERPFGSAAVSLLAVGYAGVLPVYLIVIRHESLSLRSWSGTALVFFPLVVTWVTDSAAMFVGRAIGGPKLAPRVSPGKTRAGAVGGLLGGAMVALIFALWLFPAAGLAMPLGSAVAMAIVLAFVGQIGDLAESLLKREAGVKDSSSLIPGHGGVLDRFDSLYFVIPVALLCYRVVGLL